MSASKRKPKPAPVVPPTDTTGTGKAYTAPGWSVETVDPKVIDLEQRCATLTRVLAKLACRSEPAALVVIKALVDQLGTMEWMTGALGDWGKFAAKVTHTEEPAALAPEGI